MASPEPPIVWAVGGSDCGGGAGIQADLATFADLGVHGCSVVTTVTAQNTVALTRADPVAPDLVAAQLTTLLEDLPPSALKIGALGSRRNAEVVLDFLENHQVFTVWDPVRAASVGGALGDALPDDLICALLRRVDVVTPNAEEAAAWDLNIADMAGAARALAQRAARHARLHVLMKGGHTRHPALDYWQMPERGFWLEGEPVNGAVGHGGGCSLAAALAAAHALGHDRFELPVIAKAYVSQGLRHAPRVGAGRAPVAHRGWPDDLVDLPRVHDRWPVRSHVFPAMDGRVGLYAVVDSAAWVERLVPLGVPTIQLRIKHTAGWLLDDEIERAVAAARRSGCRLFVNDDWERAMRFGAYGVHLGQEDLDSADLAAIAAAGLRLGISCHSDWEIARAHALAPSYIALGPIYPTTTKAMKFAPQGLERLARWVRLLKARYPLVAIGGIDLDRLRGVMATGVENVAVVRAITQAADYRQAVAALMRGIDAHTAAPQ